MNASELITTISQTDISKEQRLDALQKLALEIKDGNIKRDQNGSWVNNHIHTCYSFSPYTPTSAVFYAWKAGLETAGIMDHDSVGGTYEFIEAGKIMNMPVTCGFECRVNVKDTPLEGKRINNPDQLSCAYLAMHGIPHQNIIKAEEVLSNIRKKRNLRNRKMCEKISQMMEIYNISLNFDDDVYPISMAKERGSVTERHILFALTKKITDKYINRDDVCSFIEKITNEPLDSKTRTKLLTAPDNFYMYDILGILKSRLVEKFYINATDECMHISEFTSLAKTLGAISAYAYIGDVGESPTGDKKAQKFEDDYLSTLFKVLVEEGFSAVTYMPSRNTKEQLSTVMKYCHENNLFEISGEDINSPRQSFICPALSDPSYSHLTKATYALIGHEVAASDDISKSMFSSETIKSYPNLNERINLYAKIGGLK